MSRCGHRRERGTAIIDRVEIRNWQSLRRIDCDLGRFTVIVGASSSGKSAFMRAMRATASNVRGTNSITRGQKSCAITVRTGDTVIALERGEGSGTYSLVKDGHVTRYTKLAGGVPEQITDALRIAPVPTGGTSVNFAGQFDKPYLLDESGSNVARELGELTNVNIIFEAVRTANRKRTSLATALKQRETDLAALTARISDFADLPTRITAAGRAEHLLDQAVALSDKAARLRTDTDQLALAEQVLQRHQVPAVPDLNPLMQHKLRRDQLKTMTSALMAAQHEATAAASAVAGLAEQLDDLNNELHELLVRAGRCPTCGQNTA